MKRSTSLTPQQRWYRKRKKRLKAAQYYANHREEHLERVHQGRARRAGNTAIPYKRSEVIAKHGMWCYLCETVIPKNELVLDHVVPIAKGGSDTFDNVRPAHNQCNLKKGNRLV